MKMRSGQNLEPEGSGDLLNEIRGLIENARRQTASAVNVGLTALYWRIGNRIRRQVLQNSRAAYGEQIVATLSRQLSWSHFRELLPLGTALSKQPDELVKQELANLRMRGDVIPAMLLKDPYILDFLGLSDRFLERDLEDAILRELKTFPLEMGSGFSFVARQKRIQLDGEDFYIDLLLFNRKLKRLIVVELKQRLFKAEYKGQMELYLRWLAKHETEPGEQNPLGIILCAGKSTEQIELLELGAAGIHVAEYLTVLPPAAVLQEKLHRAIEITLWQV